ncbi:hypothetical protein [Sphingomonas glacialis]|uniref:GNAT family N-acetyltransferase n=1 Tax=Sphingomonas glacialis TaxID=658225 RepID=A0A502FRK3_9SPHN|nr:hypothetical protein [Sphingomonas glacialis]TPG52148.1 hypothetical protein EAH76_15680 [Sphingomonas glacialis]
MPIIRNYASTDLDALHDIALATGDGGSDASREFHDPELLGHVYAAPYATLEPELALVIEDQHGVAGYCVGALHTRAFEDLLDLRWRPTLRHRYPLSPVSGGGFPPFLGYQIPSRRGYKIHKYLKHNDNYVT